MMKIVKSLMADKGRPNEYIKKTDNVFPKRTQNQDVEIVDV